ncbi:MAG: tRNA (N6-isopentenyl adenosine(37)-C2)-methylthiotransferase MiaB [Phycisphaerae bacterium]|nr:tRNA (N6-isopentenyl adenosine(37)-C2)-methylthiotransferase MiaB [Phycisphaerae bacterium]
MTGRTVYLETMGCQMNVLDSELVMGELLRAGWRSGDDMLSADLVILNTCSVRQHAEDKVYSRLGQLKSKAAGHRERIVAVIGCMAERDGDGLLKKMPGVDILCGPGELHRLPALIRDVEATGRRAAALSGRLRARSTALQHRPPHDDLESLDSSRVDDARVDRATGGLGRFQAYVRITRGCNKFCTFCVVPMTRGSEVHRPPERIVAEVRRLADAGVMEVTLLGQTVNHYRFVDDRGRETSFADLLRRVHDEVPQLPRLRFVTSFPRDFTDEALRVMAERPRICRYLHLPAQSGSNEVLRRMNRGYTVEQYLALLERARELMPDVALAGDMIVGFPGETERDFEASIELLRAARYKNCFIFKYSPRPGTRADERFADDIPDEVKRRRNNDLLAVQSAINLANHGELIEREVEILVEGFSKAALRAQESEQDRGDEVDRTASTLGPRGGQLVGRTRGDQIVVFDGPSSLIGRLLSVRIVAATPYTLHGVYDPMQASADDAVAETRAERPALHALPILAERSATAEPCAAE